VEDKGRESAAFVFILRRKTNPVRGIKKGVCDEKVSALLCALLATVSVFAKGAQDDTVVVYAALDEKTANELAAAFKEATGLNAEIALQIEEAGTIAARIKAESTHPRADVFIGGNSNFHTDLASGGYLEKYTSPVVKEAKIDSSFMDPDGYWTGWYLGALCLIYNNRLYEQKVKPLGLNPPSPWDDLLNPVYKNQVIASNPATTGGAYLMLCAQIFRLGSESAGFDYIRKLDSNVAQYTKGANGSIPLVAQGEAMVGFAWGHDALKQKMQGNLPITVVFPKDTGFEIGCGSILKGAPHADAAKKFIDFLLSPQAGKINAKNGFRYPVRADVEMPAGVPPFDQLKLAPWDLNAAAVNVDRWKKQWSEITGK
jgi:iron(III) transport system substrate-binding protein